MPSTKLYTQNISMRCLQLVRAFYSSQPAHARSIRKVVNTAILGAPNSGKSTLINKIVERKICAASCKVHTTTTLTRAMCYEDDTQIIFLDTPGIITEKEQKKYQLPESMMKACEKSLRCADVIGVVHDVSNKWTKESLHKHVVNMLNLVESIPSFLILNKIDRLKSKKQLLSVIRNLTNGVIAGRRVPGGGGRGPDAGYGSFSDVFLVSALHGDGVAEIKKYLVSNAKTSSLQYSNMEWTDRTPETLIEEAVRAKFLDFLAQEIPYKLNARLEYFDENEEKIISAVVVECPSVRLARLISGAGGGRLQQIRASLRADLADMFQKTVLIDITLTVSSTTM